MNLLFGHLAASRVRRLATTPPSMQCDMMPVHDFLFSWSATWVVQSVVEISLSPDSDLARSSQTLRVSKWLRRR
jgi:hypothetical protein